MRLKLKAQQNIKSNHRVEWMEVKLFKLKAQQKFYNKSVYDHI